VAAANTAAANSILDRPVECGVVVAGSRLNECSAVVVVVEVVPPLSAGPAMIVTTCERQLLSRERYYNESVEYVLIPQAWVCVGAFGLLGYCWVDSALATKFLVRRV
jgi:hypothetical protein